jgi:transposase InsO family protein
VARHPGPCRQPQTGPASDAAGWLGGDLPAAEHEQAGPGAQDLPHLLGGISIERVNQVWCADVTYIPMAKGFLYLATSAIGAGTEIGWATP